MAVVAPGSKYTRNTRLYIAVVCLFVAVYFTHDGWFGSYRDTEMEKNDGKPTVNLLVNQYGPIPLSIISIVMFVRAFSGIKKSLTADEKGLHFSDGKTIEYGQILKIDKGEFSSKGKLVFEYKENDKTKRLMVNDRVYDKLGLLLDEIVKQTGAAPESSQSTEDA